MKYINQDFLQRELSLNGLGYLPFVEWSTSEIVRVNNLFKYVYKFNRSILAV